MVVGSCECGKECGLTCLAVVPCVVCSCAGAAVGMGQVIASASILAWCTSTVIDSCNIDDGANETYAVVE